MEREPKSDQRIGKYYMQGKLAEVGWYSTWTTMYQALKEAYFTFFYLEMKRQEDDLLKVI